VLVGQHPYATFDVDHDVLVESSGYFRPFLQNHKPVILKDEIPQAFATLVDCMYSRSTPFKKMGDFRQTIEAYILADKLAMRTCQNMLMDEIRSFSFSMHVT